MKIDQINSTVQNMPNVSELGKTEKPENVEQTEKTTNTPASSAFKVEFSKEALAKSNPEKGQDEMVPQPPPENNTYDATGNIAG